MMAAAAAVSSPFSGAPPSEGSHLEPTASLPKLNGVSSCDNNDSPDQNDNDHELSLADVNLSGLSDDDSDDDSDSDHDSDNTLLHSNLAPAVTQVLERKPADDDCLIATQTVQEGDTVLLRYAVWNPDGSLFAASHESYPYRAHWHTPGQGICAGLDSFLVGMACGDFAAVQFAGQDMEPQHPNVRIDPSHPFVVVDVQVLAIAPRSKEFTIQWLSRLEDLKLEANRLLKAGDTPLAIIHYQAGTELLEHHVNSSPKPHPTAAALLATLHLNQAQAYLTLREPSHAEVKARAVFIMAVAPPTTVAAQPALAAAAPGPAATSKVSTTPLANMLRSPWTTHRFDLPEPMLRKAAFRLARALLDQNLDAHAHAVCAEALRMWPSTEAKQDFAPVVAQLTRNREKVKRLAKTMLKDIPPPPPELIKAQEEKEKVREEERRKAKEAADQRKREIEEHKRREEEAAAKADAGKLVVDDSDIDLASLTPEQREFLQYQREVYARQLREAAVEESDDVKALEWAASRDEFALDAKWAEAMQAKNEALASQAGSRVVVADEWSSEDDGGGDDDDDDKDEYVVAKHRVSKAISTKPDKPKLAKVDGYDSDDDDAPMPDPAEVVPAKLSLAKLHADIARTYQPRTQYNLSALVSFFSTNYAGIRPWINRWRDLCQPLVDHIITQLMVAGIVELYDIGARKNNPQALPQRVQARDLVAASIKGASARALASSAVALDEDEMDDDGMPSATIEDGVFDDDTAVPITALADDQNTFKFMLAPLPGVHLRATEEHLVTVFGPKVEPFLDPNAVRNIRFKLVRGNFAPFGAYNVDKMAKAMVSSRLPTPIPKTSPLFLGSKEEMAKAYIGHYVREGEWELIYDPKMGPKHAKVYVFGGGEAPWPPTQEGEQGDQKDVGKQ